MTERDVPRDAIPEPVRAICRRLAQAGHSAWIVGGCIRDVLMGRTASDWDVATTALPAEVQMVFKRVIPTGVQHGTVTVLWRGEKYEVTTLRGEGGYSDGRRPDRVFFVREIEEDLARRDFTVNAIAFDPITGKLVDPFGGLRDLDARLLRAVGRARERFDEDGLRVLRAARFVATLEMAIDPDTEAAIAPSLDTFRKVSAERVRDEWMKAMKARAPSRAFEVMRRTGILGVTLPELEKQHGCEQNRWHAYDVWTHSMHALDACEGDPTLRVAALLHDLGKPATQQLSDKTGEHTFYNHEVVGAEMASEWLRAYRFSNEDVDRVTSLVRHHLICYSKDWTDAAVRRFLRRIGEPLADDLLALARADTIAKGRPVEPELGALDELRTRIDGVLAAGAALRPKDLAISGHDVMTHLGVKPGPIVGKVLDGLLERVIEEPALNDRDKLLALVDEVFRERGGG